MARRAGYSRSALCGLVRGSCCWSTAGTRPRIRYSIPDSSCGSRWFILPWWDEIIASHVSLRAQSNRARNKNVSVELWPSDRAESGAEDVASGMAGDEEMMIDAAVRWVAQQGADYVALGLAPLSTRGGRAGRTPPTTYRGKCSTCVSAVRA